MPRHLLSTLADSDRYPFRIAASLLTALDPEHSADRINIFNQALSNFENHSTETSFGGDEYWHLHRAHME
jgi:hypothetical protein